MTTEFPLITYPDFELVLEIGARENTNHHPDPNFLTAGFFFYCLVKDDIEEYLKIQGSRCQCIEKYRMRRRFSLYVEISPIVSIAI